MQLYVERGFEETTVAEIAARAGVTARTFFRHFADKREVLFGGSSELQTRLVAALEAAPEKATPMQAVAVALDAAGALLGQSREHSRQRQAVINSHAELRERELIKLAALAAALAAGLRRRGVPEPDASLAAESGIVVLRVAFGRWAQPAEADQPNEAGGLEKTDQLNKAGGLEKRDRPNEAGGSGKSDRPNEAGGSGKSDRPNEAGGREKADQPEQAGGLGRAGEQGDADGLTDALNEERDDVSLSQMMRDALERLTNVTAER
jgi:AcrR family transcriptional regulator